MATSHAAVHLALALGLAVALAGPAAGQVTTEKCSVALGGSANGSTINLSCLNGMSPAEVRRLVVAMQSRHETALAAGARQLGIREGWLEQILLPLLKQNSIRDDQLAAKVSDGIARIRELIANAAPQPGDPPAVAALRAKVEAIYAASRPDLQAADTLLADLAREQDKALTGQLAARAETAARRADIALLQWRASDAAKLYAEAARFTPNSGMRDEWLWQEANAWWIHGNTEDDSAALTRAVARWQSLIADSPREHGADWRASLHAMLGFVFESIGKRESGRENLTRAVTAFNEALLGYTREHEPKKWAATQKQLGDVLIELGTRESGTESLERAVSAFNSALLEQTRERTPLDWAVAQNDLGVALMLLGARESGTESLTLAVAAFNNALQEFTRERTAPDWAQSQDSLGAVLWLLSERETGTENLTRAVAAINKALLERTRERDPLEWAGSQANLGVVLGDLSEHEGGTESLTSSLVALHNALLEFTRDRTPLEWAGSSIGLAGAEALLALRTHDPAALASARRHYADGLPFVPEYEPGPSFRDKVARRIAAAEAAAKH